MVQLRLFNMQEPTPQKTEEWPGFECSNGHEFSEPEQTENFTAICPICGTKNFKVK